MTFTTHTPPKDIFPYTSVKTDPIAFIARPYVPVNRKPASDSAFPARISRCSDVPVSHESARYEIHGNPRPLCPRGRFREVNYRLSNNDNRFGPLQTAICPSSGAFRTASQGAPAAPNTVIPEHRLRIGRPRALLCSWCLGNRSGEGARSPGAARGSALAEGASYRGERGGFSLPELDNHDRDCSSFGPTGLISPRRFRHHLSGRLSNLIVGVSTGAASVGL